MDKISEWIPYLKLNYINYQMGFIIPWSYMHQIKDYHEAFINDKTNYIYSAFSLDFHCGNTERKLSNNTLILNRIVFHRTSIAELQRSGVPAHRCLFEPQYNEKTFFNINPNTKNNRCGNNAHPEYNILDHPLFKVNNKFIRTDYCGYSFCFFESLNEFMQSLSDCYDHIDLDEINWQQYDIPLIPLRGYLYQNSMILHLPQTFEMTNPNANQKRFTLKLKRQKLNTIAINNQNNFSTTTSKQKNRYQSTDKNNYNYAFCMFKSVSKRVINNSQFTIEMQKVSKTFSKDMFKIWYNKTTCYETIILCKKESKCQKLGCNRNIA
eukprot:335196_1